MKKFSLKALGAAILTLGLVVAGGALPASAAALTSPSATSTGTIGTSGTNAYPITVTATTTSPMGSGPSTIRDYIIELPTGWSFATEFGGPNCNYSQISFSGLTASNGCSAYNIGSPKLTFFTSGIPAQSTIQVTFNAGFLNVTSSRTFSISTANTATVDTATASLASAPSSYTVSFNSNGGSGAMADQSASAATALSANAFTRSGYTFAGWNTAADGSGTAYADGASFPFSANATLYAQWTATLATTGFDAAPYLFGGLALALTGGALMLFARRKQSN